MDSVPLVPPTPPTDIPLSEDFGFGSEGESSNFQPIHAPFPPGVIPVDLKGDGNTDYIIPGHDTLPGTTTMIGYITVDNVSIMIVAGEDIDRNGRLDRDEVIDIVG